MGHQTLIYVQGQRGGSKRKGGAGMEWVAGRIWKKKLQPQGAVRHAALPDRGGELHLSNAWRKNGQEMTAPMGSTVGDADPLLVERENSR